MKAKKIVCTSYLEAKAYNNFLQSELQRPKAFDIISTNLWQLRNQPTNH
jgi:hypothetical protein